jgi:NO-binding membrane sensor protein with MHYT domain
MLVFHDCRLVASSLLISELGAYGALNLAERMNAACHDSRCWLIEKAAASCITAWSMHYIAMAALNLPAAEDGITASRRNP